MFKRKNKKNMLQFFDDSVNKMHEKRQKTKLSAIDLESFDTRFNEKGNLECVLFKTRQKGETYVRIMRLLRIKSVSNEIYTQINNEEAFKNILNQFGNGKVSFVSLYGYKPGENLIISYGIVMEGRSYEVSKMEKESQLYIKALEDKFRSAYTNIEIEPITITEEWLFEGFYYDHLTVVRGVPKPDPSIGGRVGSSPYSNAPMMGRQVSEILLKGMTANKTDNVAEGYPFLMYSVFDKLDYAEIERALHHIQNTLGILDASKQLGVSENENFSFPLLFGFGVGDVTGQSDSVASGTTNSSGVTNSEGLTQTVSDSVGRSSSFGTTDTQGTSSSIGNTSTTTEGSGGNVGISYIVTDSWNYSNSEAIGESTTEGVSTSKSNSSTTGFSNTTGTSEGTSTTQALSTTEAFSNTQTQGISNSQSNSNNLSGGVSGGDGSGINRQQIDHFMLFAIETYMKHEQRFQKSLRDGMYDFRTFILTKNQQAKVVVEELVKQSYMDNDSPFPIRIISMDEEEEKALKKYVKTMAKPLAPETKPAIPERYRYSTYITPMEATAFNLPQENLPGYLSSFDPVPKTIAYVGKMEDGAEIGYQLNRYLNELSPTKYMLTKERLGHIGIFGATNQGKTVFVQKFVSAVHNKYDINFLLFDWTRNHRSLIGHLKDAQKFRYNSFEKGYFPLRINLVEPPKGVSPYVWNPVIAELMCYSMGLGDRSFRIITKVLKKTQERASERGYIPTMEHFVTELGREYSRRMGQHGGDENMMDDSVSSMIRSQTRFMPSNEQQSFGSMIERMEEWLDKEHPVYQSMCGTESFMTIDQLIDGDFVHLIECAFLPAEVRQFVINGVTAAIFQYCKSRDVKLKKPSYILFEEAHTVLQTPTGNEPLNINETIFETINREARNFNLLIGYICQSPEKLPPLIFDNLPIRVVFQIPDDEGKKKLISAGGKDPLRLDVDLVKWLSRQPMGTCLIRSSKFHKIQDAEFIAVKVDMLPTDELSNEMFRTLYIKNKLKNSTA